MGVTISMWAEPDLEDEGSETTMLSPTLPSKQSAWSGCKKHKLWSQTTWVQMPAMPRISWATLYQFSNLSVPQFPPLNKGGW